MTKEIAHSAIMAIAEKEGISVEAVREEMNIAIKAAYENPDTKANWDRIFGEGVLPTPEEFISIMAKQV